MGHYESSIPVNAVFQGGITIVTAIKYNHIKKLTTLAPEIHTNWENGKWKLLRKNRAVSISSN